MTVWNLETFLSRSADLKSQREEGPVWPYFLVAAFYEGGCQLRVAESPERRSWLVQLRFKNSSVHISSKVGQRALVGVTVFVYEVYF